MTFPILAHGPTGFWDEIGSILVSAIILAVFVAFMLRGKGFAPELAEDDEEREQTMDDV